MSPADVLAVIRDSHRQQAPFDPEADPTAALDDRTSISAWRDACDLLPASELGQAINEWFGIRVGEGDWLSVLEPSNERTLGDVCALIARHATVPRIRPTRVLGRPCMSAGAFLALRTLLAEEGIPIASMRPSTPISDLRPDHALLLVGVVGKLAPGALPVPTIQDTFGQRCSEWVMWGCGALLIMALVAGSVRLGVGALVGFVAGVVAVNIARSYPPKSVQFGGLHTLADIARAIDSHQPSAART